MKKESNSLYTISVSKNMSAFKLMITCVLGLALVAPINTKASSQEQDATINKDDVSREQSVQISPLANAKISTLNFIQAVKLGISLGVLIRPDTLNPINDKPGSENHDDSPIKNKKR